MALSVECVAITTMRGVESLYWEVERSAIFDLSFNRLAKNLSCLERVVEMIRFLREPVIGVDE